MGAGPGAGAAHLATAERSGPDHAPIFKIAVSLSGFTPEVAEGPSKKIAEHRAAEQFLIREKIWKADT
jgi:ribonuclease-3